MDIIQERLEREYNLDLIFTAPTVVYKVTDTKGNNFEIENPSKLPDTQQIQSIQEPYVSMTIHTPEEFIGGLMKDPSRKTWYSNRPRIYLS